MACDIVAAAAVTPPRAVQLAFRRHPGGLRCISSSTDAPGVGDDRDRQDVIDRERELHDPAVRRSRAAVEGLLDPEFHEFGASGRVWSRASVLEMMAQQEDTAPPAADRFVATRLATDVIHLTYRVRRPRRTTLRSSLWRRGEDGEWRIYFHQGTLQPPEAE